METKSNSEKCENCSICNVPLYTCLDGKKRCADCSWLLESIAFYEKKGKKNGKM